MRLAAFESSGSRCSVALADDTGPLMDWSGEFGNAIAGPMLEGLRGLLGALEWGLTDLDYLAAGTGPGSFTGIKIATTLVKTLGQSEGKPVIGVGTLEAIANDVHTSGPAAAFLPSRKENLFMQFFLGHEPVSTPRSVPMDEIGVALAEWTGEEALAAGPMDLPELPDNFAPMSTGYPSAKSIARVAVWRAAQGQAMAPAELMPLYVMPPSVTTPKKPFC